MPNADTSVLLEVLITLLSSSRTSLKLAKKRSYFNVIQSGRRAMRSEAKKNITAANLERSQARRAKAAAREGGLQFFPLARLVAIEAIHREGTTTQLGDKLAFPLLSALPTSRPAWGLFQVEANIMPLMYRSGTTGSMRLQALIADLQWKIQLISSDIAEEEQRTRVFNVNSVAYPLIAKGLRERRDNLTATIAMLEAQLRDVDPLARAA